ncbi:hypothetical protein FOCC_FOCC017518 [Frankliniella occidentalis]|uniref:Protein yellow n=1 Tax=Frankliniella occidentalis TaxID=133901 RepID=A0A9C6XV56_FRAOC|nr:protein yellow [Frankliniella occidentalis]KAE8737024.1 hypothetical protein FOCC_FOCC017518 [Frankliniella occidentalis]
MRLVLACVLAAACAAVAYASCDKELLNELSVYINGNNIVFPCASTEKIYKKSGLYVPKNMIATRVQISGSDVFVATPRFREGVPFTLSHLNLKDKACAPTLSPWPCWSLQEEGNCDALQNVVDLFIDVNDILWVLDVGITNTLDNPTRRCAPKVVGFNIKTGKLVKSIDLSGLVCSSSRLQYLVVDYTPDGKCYLYVSDAATRAILVYDIQANRGFRVVLPKAVLLGGANRDVLYLALIRRPDNNNLIIFSYLSSCRLFAIKSCNLRRGSANGVVVDVGPKNGKIVILGTDGASNLFFREKGGSDIYMWNAETCFKPDNFQLVQHGNDCRLATQVVPGYKRLMWVIESNFNDYIQNQVGCLGAQVVLHPLVKSCED